MTTVVVLHPGAMGSSVGSAAAGNGHEVRWVAAARSDATRQRAEGAGLTERPDLATALAGADVVCSVCPPAAALDVARQVAESGFAGVYLDANAVSPANARAVADTVATAGAAPVDGGIVGPPARSAGTTRLYLAGDRASEVAELFAGSPLAAHVIDGPPGTASALKVGYAAWTKGGSALLLAIAAFAEAEGVTDALRGEWAISQPDLVARLELSAAGVAPKAWRFEGELADSAAAFADAGLPDGFGDAAAEVYRRLARFKDTDGVALDDVLDALRGGET